MFDDPKGLTTANWQDIHFFLQWFWIYLPVLVTFAFTMLIAHAVIPSLVITGHLPPGTQRLRIPLTVFALTVLAAAVVLMVLVITNALHVNNVYDRLLF